MLGHVGHLMPILAPILAPQTVPKTISRLRYRHRRRIRMRPTFWGSKKQNRMRSKEKQSSKLELLAQQGRWRVITRSLSLHCFRFQMAQSSCSYLSLELARVGCAVCCALFAWYVCCVLAFIFNVGCRLESVVSYRSRLFALRHFSLPLRS